MIYVPSSDTNRRKQTVNFPKIEKMLTLHLLSKKVIAFKCNYRPVIILPTLSKVYENILYQQMNILTIFFQNIYVVSGNITVPNIVCYLCLI